MVDVQNVGNRVLHRTQHKFGLPYYRTPFFLCVNLEVNYFRWSHLIWKSFKCMTAFLAILRLSRWAARDAKGLKWKCMHLCVRTFKQAGIFTNNEICIIRDWGKRKIESFVLKYRIKSVGEFDNVLRWEKICNRLIREKRF